MSSELSQLKEQWEQGVITGEEYFAEKTRLTAGIAAGTKATVGLAGAGIAAEVSGASNVIKMFVLSTVGTIVVGASAVGAYSLSNRTAATHTSDRQVEEAPTLPASVDLAPLHSDEKSSDADSSALPHSTLRPDAVDDHKDRQGPSRRCYDIRGFKSNTVPSAEQPQLLSGSRWLPNRPQDC